MSCDFGFNVINFLGGIIGYIDSMQFSKLARESPGLLDEIHIKPQMIDIIFARVASQRDPTRGSNSRTKVVALGFDQFVDACFAMAELRIELSQQGSTTNGFFVPGLTPSYLRLALFLRDHLLQSK